MTDAWTTDTDQVTIVTPSDTFTVPPGEPFVSGIKKYAQRAGLKNFDVSVNGMWVEQDSAPSVLNDGDEIKIVRRDEGR